MTNADLSKRLKVSMFLVVLQSMILIIVGAVYLVTFGPLVATGIIAQVAGFLGLFVAIAIHYISNWLSQIESRIEANKERDNI